jgi:hypothetical protein
VIAEGRSDEAGLFQVAAERMLARGRTGCEDQARVHAVELKRPCVSLLIGFCFRVPHAIAEGRIDEAGLCQVAAGRMLARGRAGCENEARVHAVELKRPRVSLVVGFCFRAPHVIAEGRLGEATVFEEAAERMLARGRTVNLAEGPTRERVGELKRPRVSLLVGFCFRAPHMIAEGRLDEAGLFQVAAERMLARGRTVNLADQQARPARLAALCKRGERAG